MIDVNWFPGHMAKARREIGESLRLVDASVTLVDARAPRSSYVREFDDNLSAKPRIVALSKSDLADQGQNARWVAHFDSQGVRAVLINSVTGKGFDSLKRAVSCALESKVNREREKGMRPSAFRLLVVGAPNVGKSTFINKLSNRSGAKTADRPGVTRSQQWIKTKGGRFELLDTPGVLSPRYDDKRAMLHLAFTGAVKDAVYDNVEAAALLCAFLHASYPQSLEQRYNVSPAMQTQHAAAVSQSQSGEDTRDVEDVQGMQGMNILRAVGISRGFLLKGGEIDAQRAAMTLLDEFRAGKLGRITIEHA